MPLHRMYLSFPFRMSRRTSKHFTRFSSRNSLLLPIRKFSVYHQSSSSSSSILLVGLRCRGTPFSCIFERCCSTRQCNSSRTNTHSFCYSRLRLWPDLSAYNYPIFDAGGQTAMICVQYALCCMLQQYTPRFDKRDICGNSENSRWCWSRFAILADAVVKELWRHQSILTAS